MSFVAVVCREVEIITPPEAPTQALGFPEFEAVVTERVRLAEISSWVVLRTKRMNRGCCKIAATTSERKPPVALTLLRTDATRAPH